MENKISKILFVTLIIAIIALMNPHLEYKEVTKEKGYLLKGIWDDGEKKCFSPKYEIINYTCTEGVIIEGGGYFLGEGTFICNPYCPWEYKCFYGQDEYCKIKYKKQKGFLRWF